MIFGQRSSLMIALMLLVTASAHADQLPAPASPQEQQCANIFSGIGDVLISYMNFLYSAAGVRDRDALAKRMVEYEGTRALVAQFLRYCPADAQAVPPEAILAMAYHIIAERFGDPQPAPATPPTQIPVPMHPPSVIVAPEQPPVGPATAGSQPRDPDKWHYDSVLQGWRHD
jgi:hypothetical protein